MPALLELQRSFAAGLRGLPHDAHYWAGSDGISATARLAVYRNNSRALFEQALERTFPVVRQRVGQDYFRQLTHFYRVAHPSRAGDLHEVGREFAGFVSSHLADSGYAWLAELATLEWAVADAGVAGDSSTTSVAALAGLSPDAVATVRLRFVPSLRRIAGTVPVPSVWRANQPGAQEAPVDLASGPEYVIVHRTGDGVQLRAVSRNEFEFIDALAGDATLDAAIEESALAIERLPGLLHWLFSDAVVAAVVSSANP